LALDRQRIWRYSGTVTSRAFTILLSVWIAFGCCGVMSYAGGSSHDCCPEHQDDSQPGIAACPFLQVSKIPVGQEVAPAAELETRLTVEAEFVEAFVPVALAHRDAYLVNRVLRI